LRSALDEIDGYILVLNTYGINVWCAAGKGTFGTDELVQRIEATGLHETVDHRKLILPQLGATGIAAHEVKKRAGFKVESGPVRAADLPEYLKIGDASRAFPLVGSYGADPGRTGWGLCADADRGCCAVP
jgi:CO dehydrogenase/acetyl-CoA synthase gamma subunit (corrinoid Fe-S protein)